MNQSKNPFNHQLYPNITTFIISTELAAFKLKISLKDKTFHRCHKKCFPSVMDGQFRLHSFPIGKKKLHTTKQTSERPKEPHLTGGCQQIRPREWVSRKSNPNLKSSLSTSHIPKETSLNSVAPKSQLILVTGNLFFMLQCKQIARFPSTTGVTGSRTLGNHLQKQLSTFGHFSEKNYISGSV